MPVSLTVLVLLGAWTWRYRRADTWLLLGVTAIVSRAWTKHLLYDDMLISISMIVLWRVAKTSAGARSLGLIAGTLFAGNWLAQMAPASLATMAAPVSTIFAVIQPLLWLATLMLLTSVARAKGNHSANLKQRPTQQRPTNHEPGGVDF